MTLLFDQNLSFRLPRRLADIYPGSLHVRDVGLQAAIDERVWEYARENGCIIVSKDSDFDQLALRFGHPPKVVWIRRGNCTTLDIEAMLRLHVAQVNDFVADHDTGTLILT